MAVRGGYCRISCSYCEYVELQPRYWVIIAGLPADFAEKAKLVKSQRRLRIEESDVFSRQVREVSDVAAVCPVAA